MRLRTFILTIACLLPLLVSIHSCTHTENTDQSNTRTREILDSLFVVWNDLQYKGHSDSLADVTRPWLGYFIEEEDTEGIVYTATAIAQAYCLNNTDSSRRYLDIIARYSEDTDVIDTKLKITLYNIQATNALKSGLDYYSALYYYISGYELIRSTGDIKGQLVFLCNIVNLFYVRSDNQGMRYARTAYELASKDDSFTLVHEYPYMSMAQMYYLSDSMDRARAFLDTTETMALKSSHTDLYSSMYLLKADLTLATDMDTAAAVDCYDKALLYTSESEPGINSLIYLHYGALCEQTGDYRKALSLYKQGLDISDEYYNLEFRGELLMHIADLYAAMGQDAKAISYYLELSRFTRKYNSREKDNGFSNMLVSYLDMGYRNEISQQQLALMKVRKERTVLFAVIIIVFILSGSLLLLYLRKIQWYKTLVAQHQSYLKQINAETADYQQDQASSQTDDKLKELFIRIEQTMRKEKFFKLKNITLDTLAQKLSSNRSYVSKAINTFAGVSFYQYVNSYRIREAANIISSPDNDIPFKQLADELGYNSVSVFGQAFKKETGCTPNFYRKEVRSRLAAD